MSEKECHCRRESVSDSDEDDASEKSEEYVAIKFDFGKVDVLAESFKKICIYRNENVVDYKIKRCNKSQLYEHFTFDKYRGTRPASGKLKLIFRPLFPFQKYVDCFKYKDSNNRKFRIIVKGESVGPVCQLSANKIYFYKTPKEQNTKTVIELKNTSCTKAEFKFDVTENDIFKVEPKSGEILPEKYVYIKIVFAPLETGAFSKHLHCLIFNSIPLRTTLFGIYTKLNLNIDYNDFSIFPCDIAVSRGFTGYLLTPTSALSPFSLSQYNLNFGRVTSQDSKTLNICFTNEISNDIHVKWQRGSNVFETFPQGTKVNLGSTALFDFTFKPNESRTFFCESLTAQLYWTPIVHERDLENVTIIPRTVTIRMQGHSFPENECWCAYVEIVPEIVTLPPCLPEEYTSGTFKLTSSGHLPVMYRLIPPKKSIATMKPMMGILKPFEIVAVMMCAQSPKICIEEWKIELNGSEEKQMRFYVRTECTIPAVRIGKNNEIWFDCVQPRSTSSVNVPVKNLSLFGIRFKFYLESDSSIKFIPNEGYIQPSEDILVTCQYKGNPCFPEKTQVKCRLQACQRIPEVIGEAVETFVEVNTKCSQSFLCSTPSSIDFGSKEWGSHLETQFWVFNFGISPIYFIIYEQSTNENGTTFEVSPCSGEVNPGEKIKIRIKGIATKTGKNSVSISYKNRLNKKSLEASQGSSRQLLEIEYEAYYPTIQILEIVEHNFGALFGKVHFWEYLQIDNINDILRNIKHNTTKEIDVFLPDCEVSNDKFYLNLRLQNVSQFETEINFKKIKTCDCPMKEEEGHVNVRKKVHDCPHRAMLSLEMDGNKFYANSYQYLTLFVKYSLPYETKMMYVLQLSNNRNIDFHFRIYSIPSDILIISKYKDFYMKLKNIFIGRYVAPIQVFWLYNNTGKQISYQLIDEEIIRMCKIDGFQVLQCLNPVGEIEPCSLKGLLIKFHPIEAKVYEITIPLILGDEKVNFTIEGEGCLKEEQFKIEMPESNGVPQFFPVTFSLDYINIEDMPTWNTTERIIFTRNITKNKLIQYHWKEFEIQDVIKITYQNDRGILKPREVQSQVIKIETFSEPCSMQFLISCELLDYTQIALHKLSTEQNRLQKEVGDEFTITEKGISHSKNKIKVHPAPKTLYGTISINVNTIHRKDIDMFVPIQDQLKQTPSPGLQKLEEKSTQKIDFNGQNAPIYKNIIEEIIGEFVCSEKFKNILKISSEQPPPYYTQFLIRDDKIMSQKRRKTPLSNEDRARFRKKEVDKFFKKPSTQDLSETMKNIVIDGMHDTFKLGRITNDSDIHAEVRKMS